LNTIKIKVWLTENGFTQAEIARQLGVTRGLVWMTVHGQNRNGRVISWLIDKGCPRQFINEKLTCTQ